jgi:hypothetical protein
VWLPTESAEVVKVQLAWLPLLLPDVPGPRSVLPS